MTLEVARRLCRERALVLAAPRAVMLQYAHPAFAAASAHYSARDADPGARFGRAVRTLLAMIYEPRERVVKHARRVGRLHASLPGGHATDPDALAWVLITLVDAVVLGAELALDLDARDAARLLAEARTFGEDFGVRPEDVPCTRAELAARIGHAVERELVIGSEARAMWAFLGDGRRGAIVRRWTASILPAPLADELGSPISAIERAAWRRAGRRIARTWTRLPASLRYVEAARR